MGRPTVPEVWPLVQAYCADPVNEDGGALNIVLSQGLVGDKHVEWCYQCAVQREDEDGQTLAKLLQKMTKTQRLKICNKLRYGDEKEG